MVLLSLVLAASGLDETKAALQKLEATGPVHGELKVMRWQRRSEKDESSAGATFHVGVAPGGVSLQCSAGMLNEKSTAVVAMMNLARVQRLLDAKDELLKLTGRATLLSEEPSKWKGQPAKLLKVKLGPSGELKDAKMPAGVSFEASDAVASLVIDENGLPLASDVSGDVSGGLLMVKVKHRTRMQREYAVVNGRLVVTRETEDSSTEGVGSGQQVKQTTELKVDSAD